MADAVTSQTLFDSAKNVVMKFTNLSDGNGESAVTKVDVSALSPAATKVSIQEIWYHTGGMVVTLLWDADTDVTILNLQGDGYMDFRRFGGLSNNAGTGVTGDILVTTTGHTSGDTYTLILDMQKS